jgi:hypothetical protein
MQINSIHVESLHMVQEVELRICWCLSPTELEQYLYESLYNQTSNFLQMSKPRNAGSKVLAEVVMKSFIF